MEKKPKKETTNIDMAGWRQYLDHSPGFSRTGGAERHVVKLTDNSGEVVCLLGKSAGEEKIFFGKAVSPDQVEAVAEFLQRKKIHKHLARNEFEQAQQYADKKFR